MTRSIIFMILAITGFSMLLSGCSDISSALGRGKKSPDEFQVVVRPPLTLPPNFALRPQDEEGGITSAPARVSGVDAVSTSDQILTKSGQGDASAFDALFNTDERLADIRNIIDEETLGIQLEKRIPVTILFGGQPNVGPNLNSFDEALRIRRALATGEKINITPTPATDPIKGTTITVE
jgi:hypothetical protein